MSHPVNVTQWPAPAKLNLFLRINGRRPDGYHTIQTIFQILDWGDTIRLQLLEYPSVKRVQANYTVPPDEDLVVRAARLLQQETGCSGGVEIDVYKRIPIGAGLGGGSSNAATVLQALNHLWRCGLATDELAHLGKQLGADVPVFVNGYSAFGEGVGEQLTPVQLGTRHYVVLMPDLMVSTGDVFSAPELKRNSAPIGAEYALRCAGQNDCEPTVLRRYPELNNARETLMKIAGEWPPVLTGTGSAYFLRVNDESEAKAAAGKIKCRYNVRAVRGVDRSPLLDMLGLAA
jgi:4-diphosphocytidyl-2-C-methyl-D-erythritol kinase